MITFEREIGKIHLATACLFSYKADQFIFIYQGDLGFQNSVAYISHKFVCCLMIINDFVIRN